MGEKEEVRRLLVKGSARFDGVPSREGGGEEGAVGRGLRSVAVKNNNNKEEKKVPLSLSRLHRKFVTVLSHQGPCPLFRGPPSRCGCEKSSSALRRFRHTLVSWR